LRCLELGGGEVTSREQKEKESDYNG
jgi:hypothetical protein